MKTNVRITEPTILWPTYQQFKSIQRPGQLWIGDSETDGLEVRTGRDTAWLAGFNVPGTREVYCFDMQDPEWPQVRALLNTLKLGGHHFKFDVHAMDLEPEQGWLETMCGAYRLNTVGKQSLDDLAVTWKWGKIGTIPELKGKQGGKNQIHLLRSGLKKFRQDLVEYMADDILFTSWLTGQFHNLGAIHDEDMALERAVQRMEARGVRLYGDRLEALGARILPLVQESEAVIRAAGFDGNLASPKQFTPWLAAQGYEEAMTVSKWNRSTRTRDEKLSTNTKLVLQPIVAATGDPLIDAIMMYRSWSKKYKDFCLRLPDFICADGLIHGGIKTTRTATTRFAHETPNMGQIPKQGKNDMEREVGKAFRACFTGPSGYCSGADYGQVELRIAAAMSGDKRLLESFRAGGDPHAATAAATSGCPADSLPPGERFKAKATNFGILNGMRGERLSLNIGTTVAEANTFITKHKEAHPELHDWMRSVTAVAQKGSVKIPGGHYRIYSDDEKFKRINNAVSAKVQGGAAYLMKKALVACDDAGLRPILTVHDELVGDVRDKAEDYVRVMEEAANKALPELLGDVEFTADGGAGDSWAAV